MSKTNVKALMMLMVSGVLATGTAFATASQVAEPAPLTAPQAQQAASACTGTVLDESGEPLIGASVKVKGTTNGASTNIDGQFRLTNVKPGVTLEVSYIGYAPVTVVWNGQPVSVQLKSDTNVLDEVVVMGYGVQQKRSKVTNSVAKVSEEVLTVGSNANPAQALAGAVSGVKVAVTSGDPSATPNITVRGGTNWNNSANNPLVVVDGQIRGSLSDINPNDIADMQVLKDAGATALYGARAANGVILVTTKSGKDQDGRVTLSVKYGLTKYNTGYKMATARQYLQKVREATYYTTNPAVPGNWLNNFFGMLNNGSQAYSTGRTQLVDNMMWNVMTYTEDNKYLLDMGWQVMDDPLAGLVTDEGTRIIFKDTDLWKYNMKDPTNTQDYNLSFSGANDRGNYYASLGYYKADGSLPTTFYERYNFSFSGGYKISKWLSANSVFNYTRANWNNTSNTMPVGYLYGRVNSMPRTARIESEDGTRLFHSLLQGSSINLKYQPEKFIRGNQSDKFQMTQSLMATIIDGLTLKGTMSWYYNEQLSDAFNKDYQTNAAGTMNRVRATSQSFLRYFDQTYNLVANFNRTFAEKHTVNAMAGMEFYKRKYRYFYAGGNGAPTDDFADLDYIFTGTQTPYKASSAGVSSSNASEAILSYFGRVEYDYMDKYLVAATFREDGYSRLQDNRWGFFPGVSGGWVFTKENFWNNNEKLGWLNYGKLRASYGQNGIVNGNTIGYYTLLGAYSSYQYAGQTGFRISALPNMSLRWEKTNTFDVGLTMGFLQNRINLDVTYYNRLTMDKYANKTLPTTTGFSSVVSNNGSFRNQGVEIDLNATVLRTKDLLWTLGANLTFNKNTVVDLPYVEGRYKNWQNAYQVYTGRYDENNEDWSATNGYETTYIGGLMEGREPMHIIGYKKARILQSEAEIEALGDYVDISRSALASVPIYANAEGYQRLVDLGMAAGAVKLRPGDVIWRDRNGDNMIDTYDQYDLGNQLPHWSGGFNTQISWKGLSLYARFDMGWGFKVYDSSFTWWMGGGQGTYSFPEKAVTDTWTETNKNAKYPRYVIASNMGTNSWFRTSDVLAESGAYLACRELSLSYDLPMNICSKFRSKGLKVSVTGQNLGYLKKCTLPLPDNTQNLGFADGQGTYNLPISVIFGLNLSF